MYKNRGGLYLMNIFSESKGNCKDNLECFCEQKELNSVILKCGNSGSAIILEGTSSVAIFPIITVNTSHLNNPCTKLSFTCNIISINLNRTINFQLFRLCNNEVQANTIGPVWTFTGLINPVHISAFSFFVNDCDLCSSEECKYAVVAAPSGENIGNVIINNATLSAITSDNSKSCLETCPIILKTGAPRTTIIPEASISGSSTTVTVASVAVNTSLFCNPCKRFEFASNIIVPIATPTAAVNLTFQIFKNCKNGFQPIPVGSQWTFLTTDPISEIFTFFVCDCNDCGDECCTYTVQVTATVLDITGGSDGEGGRIGSGDITISNATLSVFSVDD